MTAANWPSATLGEVASFGNGGAWSQEEYRPEGIRVVRVTDVKGDSIDLSDCKFLAAEAIARYGKHLLRAGDLVVCTVGSHPTQPASVVGRAVTVPKHADGALLNQNAVCIRPATPEVNARWLGLLGRSPQFHDYIIGCAGGAASQVRMPIGLLKVMPIKLPPLRVQQRIASILSAYDDLIENNTRRIAILEEMARRLYEEWFVRFRFPGHEGVRMVESELGLVPEGWEIRRLGDIVDDVRDGVHPDAVAPETPYVGLEHIPRRSIALSEWGEARDVGSTKLRFRAGDILFGKIRPYFHKVAVAPLAGVASSDAIVIRPKSARDAGLALAVVSSDPFVAHATQTSNGTKMPRANWTVLCKYPVPMPPGELQRQFENAVAGIVSTVGNHVLRNRNLRTTRDLLLPKLISGELDVSALPEPEAISA